MKAFIVLKNPQVDIIADIDPKHLNNSRMEFIPMNNVSVVQAFDKQPYPTFFPFAMCKDFFVSMPYENISFMAECEENLAKIHMQEIEKAKENKLKFVSKEQYDKILEERKAVVNNLKK